MQQTSTQRHVCHSKLSHLVGSPHKHQTGGLRHNSRHKRVSTPRVMFAPPIALISALFCLQELINIASQHSPASNWAATIGWARNPLRQPAKAPAQKKDSLQFWSDIHGFP